LRIGPQVSYNYEIPIHFEPPQYKLININTKKRTQYHLRDNIVRQVEILFHETKSMSKQLLQFTIWHMTTSLEVGRQVRNMTSLFCYYTTWILFNLPVVTLLCQSWSLLTHFWSGQDHIVLPTCTRGVLPWQDFAMQPATDHEAHSNSMAEKYGDNSVHKMIKLSFRIIWRPNLTSSTTLLKCSDVPTKVELLLAQGSNFGRMPFLPPPMTHMGTSGSWTQGR